MRLKMKQLTVQSDIMKLNQQVEHQPLCKPPHGWFKLISAEAYLFHQMLQRQMIEKQTTKSLHRRVLQRKSCQSHFVVQTGN